MFIVSIIVVAILLLISEAWWRNSKLRNETSRKFIHITVGSFVAYWPFILSWWQIRLLSLMFLIGVVLSKYLHILRAIHSVQRPTWGEIFFAISVGAATFITNNKWIYMAALLQMSLADGLAAIAGVNFGKRSRYRIFGHTKSLIGSLVCLAVSLAILVLYSSLSGASLGLGEITLIGLLVSILENLSLFGLDNLVVPLVVAVILTKL